MAFSGCSNLKYVNLENVEELGYAAFSETSLTSVDLSSAKKIGDYAFTFCDKLTSVILNPITSYIGEGSFSYCTALSGAYNLNKVDYVGDYSFAYTALSGANLECATYVGDFAFIKEELTPFEVILGENIVTLGDNPFALCQIGPFYKIVEEVWNGKVVKTEYVYTYDIGENVKIIDGSIYCKVPNGLELTVYVGLDMDGKSLDKNDVQVADGTVRISGMAFIGADITRVTLPHSLRAIGHKAFYQCGQLMLVTFKSYEAPVLEEEFDQNLYDSFQNIPSVGEYEFTYWEDTDGDGKLDTQTPLFYEGLGVVPYYMWNISSTKYNNIYYGASFVDHIGYVKDTNRNYANMGNLIMVAPSNGVYYDSFIFSQYFSSKIDGAVAADSVTLAAIAAINALPDRVTLEDEPLVIAARAAYNKISSVEQQALVTEYLQKLVTAENLIKAYKNSATPDEPGVSDPAVNEKDRTKIALILLTILEAVEIVGIGTAIAVWFYLRRKKKMREALALLGERKTVTVKKKHSDEKKTVETDEEHEARLKEYEKRAEEANVKYERNRKIKSIVISSVLLAVVILGVMFVATKCSKDNAPYEGYGENGYTVSIKYDANGGIFTTNTSTLVDTYNLDKLPTAEDGSKHITLIDPNSKNRGNQAYLAAKVGYNLAGWYAERTEVTDESGNVIGYTYSSKWDFENAKYAISASANYDPTKPILTLYAAWVPNFTYEFYSVDDNGSLTLLSEKKINPVLGNEFTIPSYDAESGTVEINGVRYTVHYGISCTADNKIEGDTVVHTGVYDPYTATVTDTAMKIYCKPIDETSEN